MRFLQLVPEEVMVAIFLKAELGSPRWQTHVLEPLSRDGKPRTIVSDPDVLNATDNAYRAKLLGYRGYKQNVFLFAGFPSDVQWKATLLDIDDLKSVKVINQEPWFGFSGGSRLASDAAKHLNSGVAIHQVTKDISAVVAQLLVGKAVPDLILVGTSSDPPLVIIEGHVRTMTALIAGGGNQLPALVGISSQMASWKFY